MGRLTGHPNIVNILQVGATDSGLPYIVMPYHPQDSLDARIRRRRSAAVGPGAAARGEDRQVRWSRRTGSGILHRDVKPANILLTDYGEPELADFGIAHISGGFETATGAVTGSPAYTAPEVLGGDPPSPAADVYGLGATLFSALTGHAAFERRSGEQVVAQFLRITTQEVPDLREHGIPDDVSAVIARAMSREPDQRPATAADFGEELRPCNATTAFRSTRWPSAPNPTRRATTGHRPRACDRGRAAPPLPGATGNLPLELTSFVGRRHELTEAKNLLAGSRLVTLTGIGGVGKTRLAMRVAASVQREYADGVRLVELGELRDESSLVDAVAAAVGVRDHSARPLREVLIEFLAAARAAVGPRQLRTRGGRGRGTRRDPAAGVPAAADSGHQPRTPGHRRGGSAAGPPAGRPGSRTAALVAGVAQIRCGDPVRRTRRCRRSRVRAHRGERGGGGGDLPPARRVAAADRIGGGPVAGDVARADPGAADRPLHPADPRQPGCADAATDAAVVYRLELRVVHRR